MLFKYRKTLLISLVLLVGGIGAWCVYAHYRVEWCKKELARVKQKLHEKGYTFSYGTAIYPGPFSFFEVRFQNVHFKTPEGTVEWDGEEVRVGMQPWHTQAVEMTVVGKQTVHLTTDTLKPRTTLTLWGVRGTMSVSLLGTLNGVDCVAQQVAFSREGAPHPLILKDVLLHADPYPSWVNAEVSFRAKLQGVEALLGETENSTLDLSFEGALSGFQPSQPLPYTLAAWSGGGGILNIKKLSLNWAPITLEGEGTLTFDQDLYPLGAFSTQVSGIDALLKHMVAAGWVKKKNAKFASFLLSMMGRPNKAGETVIKIPLTLQKRALFLGGLPFPLIKNIGKPF